MIQSAESGGEFEYVSKGRDYSKNIIDKSFISKILNASIKPNKINADAGTLVLFYGRNYLHRVTPVKSKKPRILVTLNYNEEEGVELSENARLTFFGRINLFFLFFRLSQQDILNKIWQPRSKPRHNPSSICNIF